MFDKNKKETSEEARKKWAVVVSVSQDPPSLFLYHLMMRKMQTQSQAQSNKREKSCDSNGQLECARYYNMSI